MWGNPATFRAIKRSISEQYLFTRGGHIVQRHKSEPPTFFYH